MKENFLFTDFLEDLSICDDIIEYFNTTEKKGPGQCGIGQVHTETKISTDASLRYNLELQDRYLIQLRKVTNKYLEKYPFANFYAPFAPEIGINIQHYKPGEGYYDWHTERTGTNPPVTFRHLVFMTYLNDVEDGGETEYFHQEIKLKPKKGLTAIWPADWTYTHRGIPSPTQEKYIVTGWYIYTDKA